MNKQILTLLTAFGLLASLTFVVAGPTASFSLIGNSSNPIYTEADFQPLVFLNELSSGRILYNQAYWQGPPGEDGNITERTNNYAFSGERIQWKVLVWDKNGVPEKINDVWAGWADQTNGPIAPDKQVNCQYLGAVTGNLASKGYSNVRRPNDQEAQVNGNADTMGEYLCTLTIEPSCHGQKWFGVNAMDLDNNNGTMAEAESWFCNPSLDLSVSGNINFGELGPGEQGASTFSIKNDGEAGSGVQVVLAIDGTDFYDPSSSGALCPTTNQLKLQGVSSSVFTTGFWYKATMASHVTANKRIPYKQSGIQHADPVFSAGTGVSSDWTGALVPMSPGAETTMTLHLGIPQPCNGQFTNGQINLYAWAI